MPTTHWPTTITLLFSVSLFYEKLVCFLSFIFFFFSFHFPAKISVMGLERGNSFVPLFLFFFLHLFIHGGVGIWPLPRSASNGHQTLVISTDFKLNTHYSDSSSILRDAFSRLLILIQAPHVVEANVSHFHHSLILQGIKVVVSSNDEQVLLLPFVFLNLHLNWGSLA